MYYWQAGFEESSFLHKSILVAFAHYPGSQRKLWKGQQKPWWVSDPPSWGTALGCVLSLNSPSGRVRGNSSPRCEVCVILGSSAQNSLLKKSFILFIYAYNVWVIFPPFPHPLPYPPTPSLFPPTPSLSGRNYFALISNFVEESVSSNRKDQGFLLVEIRIAIQGVDLH
jgi:hypothetical protein